MNRTQQLATGVMSVLMLGTIMLMPALFHSQATYSASVIRQFGSITFVSEISAELPQDQVRDLAYN